jgi:acyl carrier protein
MLNTDQLKILTEVFNNTFDRTNIELSEEMTAADIDGWDSLAHITLIMEIESAFSVEFTTQEVMSWDNVGQMMQTLGQRVSN